MALTFELRAARADDREPVSRLLADAGLPLAGVDAGFPDSYIVAWAGSAVVGAAGLEQYDAAGLLRSVAVRGDARGLGIGRALVTDRLARARSLGLERVFLLTTTAATFFQALGFASASRREAPAAMLASPEFAGVCPDSAACLARAP